MKGRLFLEYLANLSIDTDYHSGWTYHRIGSYSQEGHMGRAEEVPWRSNHPADNPLHGGSGGPWGKNRHNGEWKCQVLWKSTVPEKQIL